MFSLNVSVTMNYNVKKFRTLGFLPVRPTFAPNDENAPDLSKISPLAIKYFSNDRTMSVHVCLPVFETVITDCCVIFIFIFPPAFSQATAEPLANSPRRSRIYRFPSVRRCRSRPPTADRCRRPAKPQCNIQ